MAEQMRALGYLCPECGKMVYGERTRFAMGASAVALVCDCGRSELTAQPEGPVYRPEFFQEAPHAPDIPGEEPEPEEEEPHGDE